MSALEVWLTIAGLTFATFVTRCGLHMTRAGVRLSPRLEGALRYAPACALAAIIVPDLVVRNGAVVLGLENARLLGATVAVGVFVLSRSVLGTIAGGMGAFWLVRLLSG